MVRVHPDSTDSSISINDLLSSDKQLSTIRSLYNMGSKFDMWYE